MSLITVPVEFFILPPRPWADATINAVLSAANRFWSQADIHCMRMGVHQLSMSDLNLPRGATVDPVNRAARLHLFNTIRGRSLGLRVFLTSSGFGENKSTGGDSMIGTNYCAIRAVQGPPLTGAVLAHEVGHCFSLADRDQPGNLMNMSIHGGGAIGPLQLEPFQIYTARNCPVVRRSGF